MDVNKLILYVGLVEHAHSHKKPAQRNMKQVEMGTISSSYRQDYIQTHSAINGCRLFACALSNRVSSQVSKTRWQCRVRKFSGLTHTLAGVPPTSKTQHDASNII